MSAFIVEDETINRVVSHIYKEISDCRMDGQFYICSLGTSYKLLLKDDYKLSSDISFNKLADDMFKLNIASVNTRYGEGEAKQFQFLHITSENLYQVLVSLRCWLYQCAEGDIPETSSLYKTMKQLDDEIVNYLVTNTAEYKAAEWQ